MSNTYVNQQFQSQQGLQPAIPFERPSQQSRTPLRPRMETPIHPPQLPQSRAPQHQPNPVQRQQQPPQIAQARPQQQQPLHPPSASPHPQQHRQNHQAELDERFRQAEQAYNAAYRPNCRPKAVYHTIDPSKTTLAQGPPYILYCDLPQEAPSAHRVGEPLPTSSRPIRFVHAQPPLRTPQQQARGQPTPTPHQTTGQAGERQINEARDEGMQQDESSASDDDGDGAGEGKDDSAIEADGSPAKDAAPLVQPITPLQYPAVRPTLLLGPYETREEAQTAVIEYGIAQGYMLVQSGCARAKTAWGGYDAVKPIVRVDFMCDRSGTCKNVGTGKRKRSTHKIGCPARIKVVCRKRDGCKWFIDPRVEMHNHDLNLGNMESIASYRRWRRIQGGGRSVETRKERSERKKRANISKPPGPVPPATFHNAGPQPPSEPTGPVHTAALKGQTKILEILLNKGGDIDAYDSTGRTALHCALEGSRMDAFQLLIARGANVTRCDAKGLSPLRMAVEKGMEDAVVMLIEKGADPNR